MSATNYARNRLTGKLVFVAQDECPPAECLGPDWVWYNDLTAEQIGDRPASYRRPLETTGRVLRALRPHARRLRELQAAHACARAARAGAGVTATFTIGSLFSGIGGLELGLEWAGLGPVLWQVECNPNARQVLEHHWPEATRYDDVRAVGATTLAPVELICGGFPCQDVSAVGKRAGLQGARSGLWFEFSRVVSELRPRWVVVENVTSGAHLWIDAVRAELERLGYASIPVPLAAADVGAPHQRERVFIVAANVDGEGQLARAQHAEVAAPPPPAAADTRRARRAGYDTRRVATQEPQSALHLGWASEPDVVRVVHGVSARVDGRRARIEALGNSVVPQCAEVVGWVIRELAGEVAA